MRPGVRVEPGGELIPQAKASGRNFASNLAVVRGTSPISICINKTHPTYDEICAEHKWRVPDRYNIAADVCDKHHRDKLAMVHERFDGERREMTWGQLQDLAGQAANLLAAQGVTRGDRVAVVLPPTPETAAIFFGTWKLGALLLSMPVL